MTSIIDICNLALQNIQQSEIASLDEGSPESIQCLRRYDLARDVTLQSGWWKFARATQTLALLDETPEEWAYAYALPDECVAPRYLIPTVKNGPRIRFERAKTTIITNEVSAKLAYTERVTNPVEYPPAFIDALSWRLGADMVLSLTGKRSEREDAFQIFRGTLADAKRLDALEAYAFETTDFEADWHQVRN